jgi:hypothetical protein
MRHVLLDINAQIKQENMRFLLRPNLDQANEKQVPLKRMVSKF